MPTILKELLDEKTKRPARKNVSSDVEKKALENINRSGKLDKIKAAVKHEDDIRTTEDRLVRSLITDIFPVPDVVDQVRKDDCKYNFKLFNETYLPRRFNLRWAKTHLRSMDTMQAAVFRGDGQYCFADPRGSGKTSLTEALALWTLLYGHKRFIVIIGATASHSIEIFKSIVIEIECNQALLDDFPEVCYPIVMLNGSYMRSRFQHIQGKQTRITFKTDMLVLPDVEGSKASSGVIKCVSVTGRVRGIHLTAPSGETIRPDFLIFDDPQTDLSAKSPKMIDTRERTILNSVKGLAGPQKSLTAVMPCTVIASNDLAERFLNTTTRPEWQGRRNKLMESFPSNMEMWTEYAKIRGNSFRQGLGGKLATDYYRNNQTEMDRGASITWEERYDPSTQISAIQFAMDLWIDDPITFASEYQNEPLILSNQAQGRINLNAKDILQRYSHYAAGVVPHNTECITTGIDIQERILYYVTTAWVANFGGVVCDYGTYPKQNVSYFIAQKPPIPLSTLQGELLLPAQIYAGLSHLQQYSLSRRFRRDESKTDYLSIDKVLIDKNWNVVSDAVEIFCKDNEAKNTYVPANGRGIGASMLPMDQWSIKAGEKVGMNWRLRISTSGRGRNVMYDTNYWKSKVAERLVSERGNSNALLLYGDGSTDHKLIADHFASEYPVTTTGRGREVDEWKTYVSMSDNHFFDCLIMSAVAASMCGVELFDKVEKGKAVPMTRKQRKLITSAMYKNKVR